MMGGGPMSNIRETPPVRMAAMFNLAPAATRWLGPAAFSTATTVAVAAATARIDAAARRRRAWAVA
jgi:hypothetical protein